MTAPGPVALADLAAALPELTAGASVVALVPAEGLDAARAAWSVARTAAATGRRTLLVDCFTDEPRLHAVVGAPDVDGIVDAFEYGASLNRIAQPQPEENLFFIPAGTYAGDPAALMASRRWQRLAAGFRHEGALLLLFVPRAALGAVAAEVDRILLLVPEGAEPDAAFIVEAATAGLATSVVRVPAPSPRPAIRRSRAPLAELEAVRRGGPARTRRVVVYAGAAVLAAVLAVVALRPQWVLPTPAADEAVPGAPALRRVDSLPWVVQVSAWDDLARALEATDTLKARGWRALVSPTSLRRGRVSFRVLAGPFAAQASADSVLDSLRARSLADPDGSASVTMPLSLALGGPLTAERAQRERDTLRLLGVPTFLLGQRDGRLRVLAGAFDDAAGAAYLDSLLFTLGRARRLGPRVGFLP